MLLLWIVLIMTVLLGGCAYDTIFIAHLIELSEQQYYDEQARATIQLLLSLTINTLEHHTIVHDTKFSCPYGTTKIIVGPARELWVQFIPKNLTSSTLQAQCTMVIKSHEIVVRDFKYQ